MSMVGRGQGNLLLIGTEHGGRGGEGGVGMGGSVGEPPSIEANDAIRFTIFRWSKQTIKNHTTLCTGIEKRRMRIGMICARKKEKGGEKRRTDQGF